MPIRFWSLIGALIFASVLGIVPSVAAVVPLTPPAVNWGPSTQTVIPTPMQQLGYDSGTGLACIVGSTTTCKLATTATSGGSGATADQIQGNGANGAAIVGNPVRVAGTDGSGNTARLITSTTGVLDSPRAGTADRVVTKTNLSLNTSTTVCPAAAAAVATELFFTNGGVGISLAGGTLTTATIGTTASTTPDLSFATAGTLYTFPASPTNAITAYGAAGIVVCIQTLRQ